MKKGVIVFWGIFIVAALFRFGGSFFMKPLDMVSCVKELVSGEGTISKEPERKESGQVFIIDATSVKKVSPDTTSQGTCAEAASIRVKTQLYPRFEYGDTVAFSGKLSQPFNFSNEDGRTFNYRGYLAKDDVFYEIKSADVQGVKVETRSKSFGQGLASTLFKLKRGFVENLERALGEPYAALAAGLVVGEKSSLGKDLLDDFRTVGLIHIIVLSGYNITIVADALRKMLGFLPRVWGILIGALGIILFGILVGGGATVVRSCFMAGVALTADVIRRDYHVVRALIFAGLLMLIQNPTILLHDPSFQLSFMATLGLILLAGPIETKLSFVTERFGMRGIVASTLATQIFVSPYILYMMGTLSIIGIVVNILVLPLIPVTMLTVFLTGALGFIFQPVSLAIGWIAHLLLSYELFMVEKFSLFPYAAIHLPKFSGWFVVGFYVIFFVLYAKINHGTQRSSTTVQ